MSVGIAADNEQAAREALTREWRADVLDVLYGIKRCLEEMRADNKLERETREMLRRGGY